MNIQYQRAKTFYRRGRSLVDFRDRPGLLPAEIMAHVYEGLLDELHETGYRVFFEKDQPGDFAQAPAHGQGLALLSWVLTR